MFAKTRFQPGRTWEFAVRQRSISHPAPLHEFPSIENGDKYPTSSFKSIDSTFELPQQSQQMWGKKFVLYLLIGLFIGLIVALILIWHFNTKNHGFPVFVDNHYAWTYGPTAVLVLVVSIWRQVDHHYKLVAPWTTLERGAALAKHSLLLDYISPIQLTSFWQSLQNGHLSVTFTILGFVILKIVTLVSTGLLVEESVVLPERQAQLRLATRFNGHLYNETEYVTKSDASLVYTAYGVLAGGLENRPGLTNDLVYQSFRTPDFDSLTEARITAEVDAFVPEFNCEPATVSINPQPYAANGSRSGDTIIIVNPSCEMMVGEQPTFVLDVSSEICPPRQLRGVMQRVNCSMDANISPFPDRQLLTLVEVEYNQTVTNSTGVTTDITSFALGIKRTKSLLCRPGYQRGSVKLTHHITHNQANLSVEGLTIKEEKFPGFEDEDLALMFGAALRDAANMFGDLSDSHNAEEFPNTMFKVMSAPLGGAYEALFEGDRTFQDAAEAAYRHISVQIIEKNILETDETTIDGQTILWQQRVLVSSGALWGMVGGIIALALITILLLFLRPTQHPYFNLATIHGVAQITARSSQLQEILGRITLLTELNVSNELGQYHFFSNATGQPSCPQTMSISASLSTGHTSQAATSAPTRRPPETWWNPLVTRPPLMVLIMLFPLILVAVLEVLQVRSDFEGGLMALSGSSGTLNNAFVRFLPALVMLLVATLFNAIDFNISVLAPFNALFEKEVPSNRSIRSSLIDKSPLVAMFVSVKSRWWAALSSMTAAIIGSVLTIVVSGLFTIREFDSLSVGIGTRLDAFDLAWQDSAVNDRSAAVFTSLTESLNLSYPRSTYEELAFPDLSFTATVTNALTSDASEIRLTAPALRATLDCMTLEGSAFDVAASYNPRILSASATVEVNFSLPPNCLLGGPGGNLSFIEVRHRVGFAGNSSFIAKLLDLHVGPYDAILGSAFGEADPKSQNDNPPGCPTLGFIYGFVDIEDPSRTSVTAMMCYQQMQQLEANLTLTSQSMLISKPPIPNEESIQLLASSSDGETAFPYRIQRHMEQSLSLFNQTKYASANLADSPVDGFFQGVLFGRKPLPESILIGEENQSTVLAAVTAFYRRYMAQAISSNMRVEKNAGSLILHETSDTFEGLVTQVASTRRLVQHKGPKLALQIMLGAMTLLGLVAWTLTRLRRLVPYNPCTIFGVAYLLVGGQLCNGEQQHLFIGEDSVEQSERTEPRYRLGWWDQDDESAGGKSSAVSTTSLLQDSELPRQRGRYGIDVVT